MATINPEAYWRSQAHNYGLSPDQWQDAKAISDEARANYQAPVKAEVTYGGTRDKPMFRTTRTLSPEHYKGLDPELMQGMRMDLGRMDGASLKQALGEPTYQNQFGTLTGALGPSERNGNPYGRNASFQGVDQQGNPLSWRGDFFGANGRFQSMPGFSGSLSANGIPGGMPGAGVAPGSGQPPVGPGGGSGGFPGGQAAQGFQRANLSWDNNRANPGQRPAPGGTTAPAQTGGNYNDLIDALARKNWG